MPVSTKPSTAHYSNVQFTNYEPPATVDFSIVQTTSAVTLDTVQFRKLDKAKVTKKNKHK
ncbi:hypothetical protein F5Y03DRAFT_374298 [Xylaria venustula]|nr:hypothetical protein F5Y03DRAFT_374298 [Xylaria venustula]